MNDDQDVLEGLRSPDPKAFHEKLYAEKMKTFVPEIPDPEMAAWLASDDLDFPLPSNEIEQDLNNRNEDHPD
jgi:hypothetical protein